MKNKEQFFCPVCGKQFCRMKSGRFYRHGYRLKRIKRMVQGLVIEEVVKTIQIQPPCKGSGKHAV